MKVIPTLGRIGEKERVREVLRLDLWLHRRVNRWRCGLDHCGDVSGDGSVAGAWFGRGVPSGASASRWSSQSVYDCNGCLKSNGYKI